MNIELCERTESHVRTYFERIQDPKVIRYLPQTVTSLGQALTNFKNTQKPNATSYGRTVYADGVYVGDVWCYGISRTDMPQAMVSFCLFDYTCWNKGVMSCALARFLSEIEVRYGIWCVGAFAFADNAASVRVLEKNGFRIIELFTEDGADSVYLQRG